MSNRSTYQLVKTQPRRVYGARNKILRDAHALAVTATEGETAKDKPLALWATDLRRGRLNVYGSLLRVIDLLYAKGFPLETALLIPRWLESYCRDLWADRPNADAIEPKEKAA